MSHYVCPECSQSTNVIETRLFNKLLRRRRKCSLDHRFSTIEIPFEAPTRIRQLITWLTKQNLDPEIASYAQEQLNDILQGTEEDG